MTAAERTFFDTNVVVYALEPDAGAKCAVAQHLLHRHMVERTIVVSTQVLLEAYSVLTRKRGMAAADAIDALAALEREVAMPTTARAVMRALSFTAQHRFSVWDGLFVQAALDAGCTTLFTEDLQHQQRFGALQVVNPFAPAAHGAPRPAYPTRRRKGG